MELKELKECLENIDLGDKKLAMEKIFNTFNDLFFRNAFKVLKVKDDAIDIVYDIYKYILEKSNQLKDKQNPKAYLIKSVYNNSLNKLKKEKRKVDVPDFVFEEILSYEEDNDLRLLITDSMKLLTPLQQEVFNLHYIQGYTAKEISKIIERPQGTVCVDFTKIKEKLWPVFKDYI